jgi:NitT/TauT family transport system permease protein
MERLETFAWVMRMEERRASGQSFTYAKARDAFARFRASNRFVTLAWIAIIVIAWEFASFILSDIVRDRMIASKLPYLHGIVVTIAQNPGLFAAACATTLSRAVIGFAVGALVGFALALMMSVSRSVERIAYPYLLLSQMIPILGLAPVLISIVHKAQFGSVTIQASDITRVIIAGYITFFPVAANALAGLKAVDSDKRALMYCYAAGKPLTYAKLMIPFAMPHVFTGLKIAAPLAVTASILVDSLGAAEGIGYNLTYALYTGSYPIFWATVLCSATMGILGYYAVVAAERVALPWRKRDAKGDK